MWWKHLACMFIFKITNVKKCVQSRDKQKLTLWTYLTLQTEKNCNCSVFICQVFTCMANCLMHDELLMFIVDKTQSNIL